LQCVAYGANDGQKMLAVFAVASGPVIGAVATPPIRMAVIGLLFLVGGVLGLRRFAGSIGGGVVPVRPPRLSPPSWPRRG
jgi:PiT family inorganic phosphate transporter